MTAWKVLAQSEIWFSDIEAIHEHSSALPSLKMFIKKKKRKRKKEKKKSIEFDVIAGKQRKNHKPPKKKEKISLG